MNSPSMLPPPPDKCQCCAVAHPPDQPHDATSLFYQFWILQETGGYATWAKAMAHCSPEVQKAWLGHLAKLGIDPESTRVRGDIKSKEEVEQRLKEDGDGQ